MEEKNIGNYVVRQVDFSPAGTTKKITGRIAARFSKEREKYHLIQNEIIEPVVCKKDDIVVVGMPVYAGRIPQVCMQSLQNLKGNNTAAVAVVVYGNREYEDALVELCDILKSQGFLVIGAGAFVAQHSIFPNVASGRPDEEDKKKIDRFSKNCMEKFQKFSADTFIPLQVNGNRPYRDISDVELKPSGNKLCNLCGSCVNVCPTYAISRDNPRITNKEKCISCTACIQVCPTGARKFRSPAYQVAQVMFGKKCAQRKEPEWFI